MIFLRFRGNDEVCLEQLVKNILSVVLIFSDSQLSVSVAVNLFHVCSVCILWIPTHHSLFLSQLQTDA